MVVGVKVKVGSTGKQRVCSRGFGIGTCVLWERVQGIWWRRLACMEAKVLEFGCLGRES